MALCGELDDATLQRDFVANALRKGRQYADSGRIADVVVSDDGHQITAFAHGSSRTPYAIAIQISHMRDGRLSLQTYCTCPVSDDCKHAAGTLYVALAERAEHRERNGGLSHRNEMLRWLTDLEGASSQRQPHRQYLVYSLFATERQELNLAVIRKRRDRAGISVTVGPYEIERIVRANAQVIQPDDVAVALLLTDISFEDERFRADLLANAVDVMLRTGRAIWQGSDVPLRRGPARSGTIVWHLNPDRTQQPGIRIGDVLTTFVLVRGPWYVDVVTGEMGEIDVGVDARLAEVVLSAPPLHEMEAASVAATLQRHGLPGPSSSTDIRTIEEPPRLALRLERRSYPVYEYTYRSKVETREVWVAQLKFLYGRHELSPNERGADCRDVEDGVLVVRLRDRAAETACVERVNACGLVRFNAYLQDVPADAGTFVFPERRGAGKASPNPWVTFVLLDVPRLREEGWTVEIDDDFPARVVVPDKPPTIDLSDGRIADVFDVDVTVDVDGKPVALVPMLLEALRASPNLLRDGRELAVVGALADGRGLAIPADRLRKIVDMLVELFGTEPGGTTIALSRALSLAGLDGQVRVEGTAMRRVRDAARTLLGGNDEPEIAVPKSLRAELRPYQLDGLRWLQRLRALGFGGILADSMGLGKTIQTLAHLLAEQEAGRLDRPALVVAPTSVLPNWQAEAQRFAPSLRIVVLHGADRAERHPEIAGAHLVVTSYALLARDHEVLLRQPWHVAVLDEAQNIKNPDAKTAQIARRLNARQRIALTGTPVENHLGELWSLFAYAEPGVLGERKAFDRNFRRPIEREQDALRSNVLGARIGPFVLRRAKEDVERDLPPKTEILRTIELSTAQRDLYETIRAAMHERVRSAIAERGLARSSIVVLDALLKLRQVCCDPRLVKAARRSVAPGAKIGMLMSMLEELIDDGRRILLFSQFTSMLALIEDELQGKAVPYVILTGDTKDRATPVRRFQAGEVPLFLISLKAGGTGLNLTAADTVIHYDPWWNPAVEQQATDRAHRIGQDKPVFVYKLICEQTIEERIVELQARKGALAAALLDGQRAAVPLDAEEIAHLFE
jgi:superfamily II DNA or RNA helicase